MAWVACVLKLRPRVAIMENVTGMVRGDAKGFVREVVTALGDGEYDCQAFVLDSSHMGVPQKRQRVFVIARRRDCGFAPLRLSFDEKIISAAQACASLPPQTGRLLGGKRGGYWHRIFPGDTFDSVHMKKGMFIHRRLDGEKPACTLTSSFDVYHWSVPRVLTRDEYVRLQSFPDDYDFGKEQPGYVCGMSVPPLMTQRLALELRRQWLG
jgi:DNA (cytosine-5)-methyltransferase 1